MANLPGAKLMVGAARETWPGWRSTDIGELNLLSLRDWRALYPAGGLAAVLAEHVLEHFPPWQAGYAARLVLAHLAPGGRFRVAVPDGGRPDRRYLDYVSPPRDGHQALFRAADLGGLLREAGFRVRPLEFFNSRGHFVSRPWQEEHGPVRRTARRDCREEFRLGPVCYTSLIMDGLRPPGALPPPPRPRDLAAGPRLLVLLPPAGRVAAWLWLSQMAGWPLADLELVLCGGEADEAPRPGPRGPRVTQLAPGSPAPGPAEAWNLGLAYARRALDEEDAVFLAEPGALLPPDSPARLLAWARRERAVVAANRQYLPGPGQPAWERWPRLLRGADQAARRAFFQANQAKVLVTGVDFLPPGGVLLPGGLLRAAGWPSRPWTAGPGAREEFYARVRALGWRLGVARDAGYLADGPAGA
ncbi:MAG: hypothetical protein KQJ78_12065 [Deltaproteobacteria bacterium]|nr:hypothetical protein [Deltaproteobacteria bacterium]